MPDHVSVWVADVFARGGELYCPRGRPAIWPHTVATADDRRFMRANRDALIALVQRGEQPHLPDDPVPPAVAAFVHALLARGITFTIRNGRLWLHPQKAYQHDLTEAERAYIRDHRQELKVLTAAGTLPAATVAWPPPTTTQASESFAPTSFPPATPSAPEAPDLSCRYGCGTLIDCARLRAERPSTWCALHAADPQEVARRARDATADMHESMRRRMT